MECKLASQACTKLDSQAQKQACAELLRIHDKTKNVTYTRVTLADIHNISAVLSQKVLDSGWTPTWVVGLWRGGVTFGIMIQEILMRNNIKTDHISIRTSSYSGGVNGQQSLVAIHAANYITQTMIDGDKILIVDDLMESGKTYLAIKDFFNEKASQQGISVDLRLAVGLRKLNKSNFDPDYHVVDVPQNDWIVLPHEVSDFKDTNNNLLQHLFPEVYDTLVALENGNDVTIKASENTIEL